MNDQCESCMQDCKKHCSLLKVEVVPVRFKELPKVARQYGISMVIMRNMIKAGAGPKLLQLSKKTFMVDPNEFSRWLQTKIA